MKTKSADFQLPIFKQGDDLRGHLKSSRDKNKSLRAYAAELRQAAKLCEDLAVAFKGKRNVKIEADTHWIGVEGPEAWIDGLIAKDVLQEPYEEELDDRSTECQNVKIKSRP